MNKKLIRFISMVRVDEKTKCWNWAGHLTEKGYGQFGVDGGIVRAHRFSFEALKGEIEPGMNVCHHCDNPSCVNPDHLFLGDQQKNIDDMMSKGRNLGGVTASRYQGKVDDQVVEKIKELRASGHRNVDIAKRFGISQSYCSGLARGVDWRPPKKSCDHSCRDGFESMNGENT